MSGVEEELIKLAPDSSLSKLDRLVMINTVKANLLTCQATLDQLGMWRTGAHVSMAVSTIEAKD